MKTCLPIRLLQYKDKNLHHAIIQNLLFYFLIPKKKCSSSFHHSNSFVNNSSSAEYLVLPDAIDASIIGLANKSPRCIFLPLCKIFYERFSATSTMVKMVWTITLITRIRICSFIPGVLGSQFEPVALVCQRAVTRLVLSRAVWRSLVEPARL